ncbi:MAG: DinB family protein [Chitinophagales bacterium]
MSQYNFDEYFRYYIELVNKTDIISAMQNNKDEVIALYQSFAQEKGNFAYADGKWTIKELLAHIIDCERIFCYRALRFARNDKTDLRGFDHDEYVKYVNVEKRSISNLLDEFVALRENSLHLFKSFDEEILTRNGTANNLTIDVKSLGYMVSGHCTHHLRVIREKYII